jgi:Xaa-Pro aminopeptidase
MNYTTMIKNLFERQVYVDRRALLKRNVSSGVIIILGNEQLGMNYDHNWYPFRQDSTFLYYFGLNTDGLAAIIDIDNDEEIIFGNENTMDDIIWTGPLPSVKEMAALIGINKSLPYHDIEKYISNGLKSNRTLHFNPQYRGDNKIKIQQWLNVSALELSNHYSVELIKAIVKQRSYKEAREVAEMHKATLISVDMHLAAMQFAKPGMKEYEITAKLKEVAYSQNASISFPPIVTVHGEVLHNTSANNTLQEGQLLLCDAGASNHMNYAGDLTSTFPVSKKFTSQQKNLYEIVLNAHLTAVEMLKPGVLYKDIYLTASQKIVEGMQALGVMKGNATDAVAAGAHAMFFQCGLGHMIGLDVHDMEGLGEQYVGYNDTLLRSQQFGMKSLRLARALEKNFTLTVEPGIYIIPQLIDKLKAERKFEDFINYDELEKYRHANGIRVEENYLITNIGSQILGNRLPITVEEIEAIRG